MKAHEVHWEVTNCCNLKCAHCLPLSGLPRQGELTAEEAICAMEKFRALGICRVCLTGGEPFARAGTLALLENVVSSGMCAEVITNGVLLTPPTLVKLRDMGVKVAISIDGDSAEANDRVRGNGVFIKAISALEMCKELGIATSLYTVVTSLNFDRLEKVGEIAKKFGCESIRFNELDLRGRARESVVDLSLSEEQRRQLPEKIGNVVSSVFGEELVKTDDGCWADGSSLYMSADGNVYKCSELFQQCPERPLGNIRSISLDTLKAWDSDVVDRNIGCCYDVYMSQHAVFVGNSTSLCGLVKDQKEITTLEELYTELELLYADITQYCRECQDPDCVGFVWLLDKENARLYDLGVPLVETDNGSSFIHSFPEKESGVLDVSVRGPACSQLCKDVRMCGIHENRPLVCRIYPVGLETAADGRIVWALHTDCHYVRRMAELNILSEFERRAMVLLNRMSRQLESQIVEKYRKVMSISVFPDGDNKYKTLQEVRHE